MENSQTLTHVMNHKKMSGVGIVATLLCFAINTKSSAAVDSGFFCDRNVHVVEALEKKIGKHCDEFTWQEVNNVSPLEIDMNGDSLTYRDLNFGWLLSDLRVKGLGNRDVHGVFDAICVRALPCHLSLSFMGQKVVFTHDREIENERESFFERLPLASLSIDNVQFDISNQGAFEDALKYRLLKQKYLKRLAVTRTNLQWINFGAFDGLNSLSEIVLSDNQIKFSVGQIFGDLPNLTMLDLSGNPFQSAAFNANFKSAAAEVLVKACRMGAEFKKEDFSANLLPREKVKLDFCE